MGINQENSSQTTQPEQEWTTHEGPTRVFGEDWNKVIPRAISSRHYPEVLSLQSHELPYDEDSEFFTTRETKAETSLCKRLTSDWQLDNYFQSKPEKRQQFLFALRFAHATGLVKRSPDGLPVGETSTFQHRLRVADIMVNDFNIGKNSDELRFKSAMIGLFHDMFDPKRQTKDHPYFADVLEKIFHESRLHEEILKVNRIMDVIEYYGELQHASIDLMDLSQNPTTAESTPYYSGIRDTDRALTATTELLRLAQDESFEEFELNDEELSFLRKFQQQLQPENAQGCDPHKIQDLLNQIYFAQLTGVIATHNGEQNLGMLALYGYVANVTDNLRFPRRAKNLSVDATDTDEIQLNVTNPLSGISEYHTADTIARSNLQDAIELKYLTMILEATSNKVAIAVAKGLYLAYLEHPENNMPNSKIRALVQKLQGNEDFNDEERKDLIARALSTNLYSSVYAAYRSRSEDLSAAVQQVEKLVEEAIKNGTLKQSIARLFRQSPTKNQKPKVLTKDIRFVSKEEYIRREQQLLSDHLGIKEGDFDPQDILKEGEVYIQTGRLKSPGSVMHKILRDALDYHAGSEALRKHNFLSQAWVEEFMIQSPDILGINIVMGGLGTRLDTEGKNFYPRDSKTAKMIIRTIAATISELLARKSIDIYTDPRVDDLKFTHTELGRNYGFPHARAYRDAWSAKEPAAHLLLSRADNTGYPTVSAHLEMFPKQKPIDKHRRKGPGLRHIPLSVLMPGAQRPVSLEVFTTPGKNEIEGKYHRQVGHALYKIKQVTENLDARQEQEIARALIRISRQDLQLQLAI